MNLVTEETLKALVAGSESLAKVLVGVSSELVNEAINLFIIEGALHILKFASVFVIFYIVMRYLNYMVDDKNEKIVRSLKTTALILSLIFFTTQSFPHLISISKALVAPKIFLMERGAELFKGVK